MWDGEERADKVHVGTCRREEPGDARRAIPRGNRIIFLTKILKLNYIYGLIIPTKSPWTGKYLCPLRNFNEYIYIYMQVHKLN
jgi:hypothetical protein